jgi:aminobenzoyl-glutamate utilization protein B
MSALSKNATGTTEVYSEPEIQFLQEGVDPYSQDDGEVSWHIPLGRVNWEIPAQIPLHNWCTTALAGMPLSRHGALMASEALYRAAAELFDHPETVRQAKDELTARQGGSKTPPPIFGSFEALTQNPQAFWSGTWLDCEIY